MMQTWARLCSRHNFRKRRPALITTTINLHIKLGIKRPTREKVLVFNRIDYFTLPLEVDCHAESLLKEKALFLHCQALA